MIAWGFLGVNATICALGYRSGMPIWAAMCLFFSVLAIEIGMIRNQ